MKSDAEFTQDWANSLHRVHLVAMWFQRQGCTVVTPPWLFRPEVRKREAFADCDLIVNGNRVEVKSRRSVEFDSVRSYPYPDVILAECYTWDRADPKPSVFLIVNPAETGFLVIKTKDSDRWLTREIFDRTLREPRMVYACPKELTTYHSFQEAA